MPQPLYACPLCLRGFGRSSLDTDPPTLTLEHAPPAAVGGSFVALTCRDCNNRAAQVNRHAVRRRRGEAFLRGEVSDPLAATATLPDTMINVKVAPFRDGTGFYIDKAANDPRKLESALAALRGSERPLNFTVSLRDAYSRPLERVAALRDAYLIAFAKFGYSYILRPFLTEVRAQIADPEQEIISGYRYRVKGADHNSRTLFLAHSPLPCLIVMIGRDVVYLPVQGPARELWTALNAYGEGALTMHYEGTQYAWPSGMALENDLASAATGDPPES